ncbi:MAG: hypothetical protein HQL22_04635 [Candidatus Omnitrophica bacterium]|nr:hypothetical protein [Candidatus Omnitrophota bacterium]
MNKILAVTLNPSIDKTILVDRLTLGAEMRARAVRAVSGGKGVNLCRALTALGVAADSLTLKDIMPAVEVRENLTVVDGAGKNTRFLESGPRCSVKQWAGVEAFVLKRLRGVSLLALCGSLPPGAPVDLYSRVIESARKKGVLTALDTSGVPLAKAVKAKPWCIKPNREEAEALLNNRIRSGQALRKALQMLSDYGMTRVLLSLGEAGLAGFDGREMYYAKVPQRSGLTVGCGDVCLAGFLAGHVHGWSFEKAVRFAAAAGSANVGREVPGDISKASVVKVQKSVKMERLSYVDH